MRCRKVEKLLVEISEGDVDKDTRVKVEQHLSNCPNCRRFTESLNRMRDNLKQIQVETPSDDILQRTQALCHNELAKYVATQKATPTITPKFIWVILIALLTLTQIFIMPVFSGKVDIEHISFSEMLMLIMIIQNVTILFFVPILLKRIQLNKITTVFV